MTCAHIFLLSPRFSLQLLRVAVSAANERRGHRNNNQLDRLKEAVKVSVTFQ
jgi:hypothetical protein